MNLIYLCNPQCILALCGSVNTAFLNGIELFLGWFGGEEVR